MTTKKKATKKKANKKMVKTVKTALDSQIVHLKKMPADGEIPAQALGILKVLKANGSKMGASALVAKLQGQIETKQSLKVIWSFYRARLRGDGYIEIEGA